MMFFALLGMMMMMMMMMMILAMSKVLDLCIDTIYCSHLEGLLIIIKYV